MDSRDEVNVHDDSVGKKKDELGNELFENEVENLVQIFFFRLKYHKFICTRDLLLLQRKYIRFLISKKMIRSNMSRGFEIYIDGQLSAKRVRVRYPRITEDIIQVLGAVCE